ncbi:unnamed protein product [Dovyalis caffra]|uniref:Uncharacterized protein n=1 Tax=Dovyalis caffra TaxID=77055 RepID=A0AAV1SLE8_9ROSI|nr:unnamed protein product [Dovyalis caffra]
MMIRLRVFNFATANEAFERVASFGLLTNVISYLPREYAMDAAQGAQVLFFLSSATNFSPILGAFLADSYVGRKHSMRRSWSWFAYRRIVRVDHRVVAEIKNVVAWLKEGVCAKSKTIVGGRRCVLVDEGKKCYVFCAWIWLHDYSRES